MDENLAAWIDEVDQWRREVNEWIADAESSIDAPVLARKPRPVRPYKAQ